MNYTKLILLHPLLRRGAGGEGRISNSDPITGQAAWYDVRVRIYPAAAGEAEESSPQFATMQPVPGMAQRKMGWQAWFAGKKKKGGAK